MVAVLIRVVTAAEVNARTILGAISVYTVLGLLFGFAYEAIARVQGTPFFEGTPHIHHGDYLFFSYTTLTTTGYGDLVPGGQPGEMIATFEMLIGQIFLVTLVAGLVAVWRPGTGLKERRERRAGRPARPDPGGRRRSARRLVGELDLVDRLRLERLVAGVGLRALDRVDHVHPVGDLAEDGVLAVEPRRRARW